MATKNNPKNKGNAGNKKFFNDKELEPIKYDGTYLGHGKYVSAKYVKTTDIVLDENGVPIKWENIKVTVI
ncbi:MAG: hypothetical protein LBC92_00035 [Rickettsiales bacterium]|jgi:hypothetical protein|nr:hypothetical protein [Rickettsiales bacterium]